MSNSCPVFLMGPLGYIEEANLGEGDYTSPLTGAVYAGANLVCSKAEADQQVAILSTVTGLQLEAWIPKSGQYNYVAAAGQPGNIFGYGPNEAGVYVLVDKVALAAGDLRHATIAGNIQQLRAQEAAGAGHWVYEPLAQYPAMGKQLQWVRD